MNKKYTPGPWSVSQDGCAVVGANGGTLVCETGKAYWENLFAAAGGQQYSKQCKRMVEQSGANAELIARAPELLEENMQLRALLARVLDFSQRLTACPSDGGQQLVNDIKALLPA